MRAGRRVQKAQKKSISLKTERGRDREEAYKLHCERRRVVCQLLEEREKVKQGAKRREEKREKRHTSYIGGSENGRSDASGSEGRHVVFRHRETPELLDVK